MKTGFLVATALSGLFAAAVASGCSSEKKPADGEMKPAATSKVKCQGINACAGHGACASASNGCAGKNGCKGKGWMETATAEECAAKGGKPM